MALTCDVQAIESMLRSVGVQYLTTPAVASLVAPMWGRAFGFIRLTAAETKALETRCAFCRLKLFHANTAGRSETTHSSKHV